MVGGIRSMRTAAALLALSMSVGPVPEPVSRIPLSPEQERYRRQERSRLQKRAHQQRAWERKQRRQAEDEMRERLLRHRISLGEDDRADKYLHSAARRRRAAEAREG
ncbi:hypothetical protein [Methylobacterium sp. E-005]|uniref:hypothetical protein n=1 Tax=Methylobacterium sp. E-005 TaxID=2836549 RepID=UPI001FBA76ED|nr:hypothetical protein [Methylobacterium sp. E-005]